MKSAGLSEAMDRVLETIRTYNADTGRPLCVDGQDERTALALERRGLVSIERLVQRYHRATGRGRIKSYVPTVDVSLMCRVKP